MNTNLRLHKSIFGVLGLFLLSLIFSMNAYSQCTYCSASTSYQDEYIGRVTIGDIDNSTGWTSGVADYTSKSTDMKAGESITAKVVNGGYWYASDYVSVFIDWNKDCDFDDSGETYSLSSSDGGGNFSGTITVPSAIAGGTTRMRVRMMYASTVVPCNSSSYGDVEDYTVNMILPAPDAGIAEIITPTAPYNEGTWPVSMKLGSYGDGNLGGCTVNWSVNGITQGSYNWSGVLKKDNTVTIALGSYNFVYPDGGPYDPFTVRVWLTNIVGSGTSLPDLDPGNNDKNVKTAPSTEDAQPIAITEPSGAFVPGSVPIYVRIRNNARKPLSVVDINWYIDGVKQGSKKWFGSLGQNETEDVMVGSYNFFFKTPLAPFEITAMTVNPNGVVDPIPTNDEVSREVAPSLVAGTYFVGGSTAHFPTLSEAVSYLNASGILGDGDVFMKINSGTYHERVMLYSFPHGNNNFYFESTSGNPNDVVLTYAPDWYENYIFGVSGVDNVTFRNLTFKVDDSESMTGTALYAEYLYNFNLSNVNFYGSSYAWGTEFSVVRTEHVTDFSVNSCNFNYGYDGITSTNYPCEAMMDIHNTNFSNYANYALYISEYGQGGGGSGGEGDVQKKKIGENEIQSQYYPIVIENNTFVGMGMTPMGGVYLNQAALIKNNTFTNFYSYDYDYAAIYQDASYCGHSPTLIEGNKISNLTGVSGMILYSNNTDILHNQVSASGGGYGMTSGITIWGDDVTINYNKINLNNGYSGIHSSYSSGMIANNLVVANGNGSSAFRGMYNNGLHSYYNTFITTSDYTPGAQFDYGYNMFSRNIVMNYGKGHSVVNNNSMVMGERNNFWTKGTTNNSDLTAWQNSTGDMTSTNPALELTDDGTFKFARFQEETLAYYPTGIDGMYENYDYYGMMRDGFYYSGYAGIILDISVIEQPKSLLACNGEINKQIQVAAAITYGAQVKYQWQKDGVDIPGAIKPIYTINTFNYETTGQYRCKMTGPANTAEGMYSDEVLVYTLRPTEVTRQPVDQKAKLGETVFFEVEVHIKGIVPPYFQHKYQWWRHIDGEEVQLMDNEYYANVTSPIMTITNLQDLHFNGADDYYYCVIEGLCGVVTSNFVRLDLVAGEIVFDVQPMSKDICFGSTLVLNANATLAGGMEPLAYRWFQNGIALADGNNMSGTGTNELTITNVGPADEGTYYVEVTSTEFGKTALSDDAMIALNYPPDIDMQPVDQTLTEGENLSLMVEASGMGPITYQWYKDDVMIDGAVEATFAIEGVTMDHNGFYFCNVTNDCGTVKSTVVQVVVNKDGGISGISEADAIGMMVTPNPAVADINISFALDTESRVDIAILDLTGKRLAETSVNGIAGSNIYNMSLGNKISNGTYFVQLTIDGSVYTRQIIVSR